MFPGIVEHHLVELFAQHLPGLGALMGLVVHEVEGLRKFSVLVDELHTVLLHEVASFHLIEHVKPLEHPVGFRNQRLTDVESRKPLPLEQLDSVAALCQ